MADFGVGRQHHLLGCVRHQRRCGKVRNPLLQLHDGFAVGDAGRGAEQHGGIVPFRQLEGDPGEILAFLGIRGLQHGHLGELSVIAVVLLVLRGMHLRIIGGHQDQPPFDAGIGKGEQGIGRHVDPHMLHGDKGARTGKRGAHGHLESDFLIGRPGGIDLLV